MDMPTVTEEHKRLHALAGRWVGEETMAPSPWGPGGSAVGHFDSAVQCDGFFVTQDYRQEKDGVVNFRGHALFGYDTERKQYAYYWVDSLGHVPKEPSWGVWTDDALQFDSEGPQGMGRYTYGFEGDDALRFTLESSSDGGATWQILMTGNYRRA